jgi:MraZ protein
MTCLPFHVDKLRLVFYYPMDFSGPKWSNRVLRGNAPAKIDDRGRLKVPTAFRAVIQKEHGRDLFVTSLTGESVRIYPMAVWLEIEGRIAQMPSHHPARMKLLDRVNFFGQVSELDPQGRVLIQPRLRESAQMSGEVDVLGQQNYLEVWNHDRFVAKLTRDPFTDDDAKALADFGI